MTYQHHLLKLCRAYSYWNSNPEINSYLMTWWYSIPTFLCQPLEKKCVPIAFSHSENICLWLYLFLTIVCELKISNSFIPILQLMKLRPDGLWQAQGQSENHCQSKTRLAFFFRCFCYNWGQRYAGLTFINIKEMLYWETWSSGSLSFLYHFLAFLFYAIFYLPQPELYVWRGDFQQQS